MGQFQKLWNALAGKYHLSRVDVVQEGLDQLGGGPGKAEGGVVVLDAAGVPQLLEHELEEGRAGGQHDSTMTS